MRSRRAHPDEVAAIAQRRLELLARELADLRPDGQPAASVPSAGTGDADGPRAAPGRHALRPTSRGHRLVGAVHDRLPPTLQGRVHLASGHVAVVAVLVAAALGLTCWWVLAAEGDPVPAPAGALVETPAEDGAVEPLLPATLAPTPAAAPTVAGGPSSSDTAASTRVVVDVAGKVRRPGIVTLPAGSRVADALDAAGGARAGVDLTSLNLARVLVDGEQVLVGIAPPAGVAASAAAQPQAEAAAGSMLVNINTADQTALEELPGVGPVTAAAILEWRSQHGSFSSVDELLEVSGIGEATLAEIAPHVTL
jgi:competence protein ComEA